MGVKNYNLASIAYFEEEGRKNLPRVIKVVKRAFRRRESLRSHKIVVFTALGEGPALAYNQLQEFDPDIIAVTFPPGFSITRGDQRLYPEITPRLQAFFNGVGITVVRGRLPLDPIEGVQAHNEQMRVVKDVLSLFGGSFSLAVQAVLSACDSGHVEIGEEVISITGDCAAVVTASTTQRFLSREEGMVINEVLCKPRNLTIARRRPTGSTESTPDLFQEQSFAVMKPPRKLLPRS